MLYFLIYLSDILDRVSDGVLVVIAAGLVSLVLAGLGYLGNLENANLPTTEGIFEGLRKFLKVTLMVTVTAMLIGMFLPSKTAIYQMSAVYVGKEVSSVIHVDKKLQKVSELIDLKLDGALKEAERSR